MKKRPTKRAADLQDSLRFSSIFLASSFSCSQLRIHAELTQTNKKETGFLQSLFIIHSLRLADRHPVIFNFDRQILERRD